MRTLKQRRADAAVYREAAEIQDKQQYQPSCGVLGKVLKDGPFDPLHKYQAVMLGGVMDVVELWGAGNEYSEDTQSCRVLLLLFMAAMVEAGDA